MITTDDLIRRIDGVELPTPGRWSIAADQPVSLRTLGWRRRKHAGTVSGGVTIAEDPNDSTLELLIRPDGAAGAEHDVAVHATMTSANPDGSWRFTGSVAGAAVVPVAVDVTYHGVYKRAQRAVAWLTVEAALPGVGGRPRLVLAGDVNADHPGRAA
jgi:hypothetical protein